MMDLLHTFLHVPTYRWTKIGFLIQLGGAVPLFQNLDFLRILRSIPFLSQILSFIPGFSAQKTAGSNV